MRHSLNQRHEPVSFAKILEEPPRHSLQKEEEDKGKATIIKTSNRSQDRDIEGEAQRPHGTCNCDPHTQVGVAISLFCYCLS
jgi:hypothetical protein